MANSNPNSLPPIVHEPVGPGDRTLYLSVSGTERSDWQMQLAIYAGLFFAAGVFVGRLSKTSRARGPRLYKSRK